MHSPPQGFLCILIDLKTLALRQISIRTPFPIPYPFVMASSSEPTALKRQEEEDDDSKPAAEDEDTGAQVAPIVTLSEVAVTTGEENEDVLLDLKAKLYRYDKEGNQWKERGVGVLKLLKHKVTNKVRLLMRQNKTLKICANHLVLSTMTVQEHQGNDKSCVWHALDFADGEEVKEELFCVRFPSVDDCKAFKDKIEAITKSEANDDSESSEADAAASLIEKLTVGEEDDKEEKPKEEKKDDDKEKEEKATTEEQPSDEKK